MRSGGEREKLTDLHTATKTEHEMESGLLLDIVVGQSAAVLELLSSEDQTLLVRRDALLVLDLGLDVVDGIGGLNLEGDGLASDCRERARSVMGGRKVAIGKKGATHES